ncbi:MAG: ribosomal protein S18-alanine N-acetyltransferase [Nitriliruptoraceae bacterium]
MTTLTIRRALPAGTHLLAALERACASSPMSETSLKQELINPDRAYFIAEEDGAAVGYIGVAVLHDEGHVMTIGVIGAKRRHGVASDLIGVATAWLHARDVTQLTLEVRRGNTAAIALYEAKGFVAEGIRPRYYADFEDAVIMWKRGD